MTDSTTGLLLRLVARLPAPWRESISRLKGQHPVLHHMVGLARSRLRSRDLEIQHGLGKGLRFNAGGSAAGYLLGTWQPSVQAALAILIGEGETFYDVGANVGFFSVIGARLAGPAGKVVCFEPVPDNFQQIRHNAILNGFTNIEVVETALGSVDAELPFWTSAEPTWGKLAHTATVPDKLSGEIKVAVRRLDGIVADTDLRSPQLIKIDVEGAEVEVLAGALETLRACRPRLLIELHGTNAEVAKFLSELEYKAVTLGDCASIVDAHWNADVVAIPTDEEWPAGLPVAHTEIAAKR
jgi:FkbM family methyltransferase